jgi:Trypsin-like peptidase domain
MIFTSLLTRSLIGLTAFIAASNAIALDAQQIFERVSPSVVVIKAGDSMGSGVVFVSDNAGLTPSSMLLTNCHVVKGHTQVTVERLGKKEVATVTSCDSNRDMAVILIAGALPALQIRTTPLKIGEPAFAVGAPQGLELSISQGIVSQLRPTPLGKDPLIQTTAAISQGSSGGGLFDSEGRLIGLTTLYFKEGQSLNFAVPLSFLYSLENTATSRSAASPQPSADSSSQKKCGWTLLVEMPDGISNKYIDYCKITGAGRFRFSWEMDDYTQVQMSGDGKFVYWSGVIKRIYDCQLLRNASTAFHLYQGKMAQGALMTSHSIPEGIWKFTDAPPNSISELLIAKVCN